MQQPPPFQGYAPPQRSSNNTVLWVILGVVGLLILLLCGGVVAAGFFGMKMAGPMVECMASTELLSKAAKGYAADHSGKLPKADKWQDELAPYFEKVTKRSEDMGPFKLWNPNGDWSCSWGDKKTGFAYNDAIAEKKFDDLTRGDVIFFEVATVVRNQHAPYAENTKEQPPKIFGDKREWMVVTKSGVDMGTKSSKFEID